MTSAQVEDQRVSIYLDRLHRALIQVPVKDREDIIREIHAHIKDSTIAVNHEAAIDRVLGLLGSPEELAGRYTTERMLADASRSFSPWLLLSSCWRWAKLGARGSAAFLVALFGYTMALGLTISAFLKPFMPSKVGMWIGPGGFVIGFQNHGHNHELLGKYFVPVILVLAFVFAIATTQALRWMIRSRAPTLP
jgi:uncharacterized membrane protein